MNNNALLIACLIALSGCQPEETKPPVVPAPSVSAASAAPVQSSVQEVVQTISPAPDKKDKPVITTGKPSQAKKNTTPIAVQQKPVMASAESAVVAPAIVAAVPAAAPKAEAVVAPVVVEVKPQAGVSEAEVLALVKKRNCFVCHMVDKKGVGPAWKDIAAKYRGDTGAQARMENKIAKGGSGAWGSMAMPPQPQVSEAERTLLARFILNLK